MDVTIESGNEVRAWLTDALGMAVRRVEPMDEMGLSREMWTVEATGGNGDAVRGIVKRDTGRGPLSGTTFSPGREAAALRALEGSAVAAARVLAVSGDGGMFLMERLPGDPAADGLPAAVRADLVANAAALHALDPVALGLAGGASPTIGEAVRANVAAYRSIYDALRTREEAVDAAFALAEDHAPDDDAPAALVHGDLGPGNFLHDGVAVTGLVDWELWHLGDPLDDLATLWFRSSVLRRDDDLPDWLAAYARASGRTLDPERLRYHRMVTMLRVAVAVLVMRERDPDRDEAVAAQILPLLGLAAAAVDGRPAPGLPAI